MDQKAATSTVAERLDAYIALAESGKTVQLQTRLYRKWFKQVSRSSATDDMDIEQDMCLLVADFIPIQVTGEIPTKVSKPYMMCEINQNEIDEKTSRHIANERLRMDYQRLREAGITFEEKFF